VRGKAPSTMDGASPSLWAVFIAKTALKFSYK
jgi:hypothetical protein